MSKLLEAIEPQIEQAYSEHMTLTSGGRNNPGERQPLYPPFVLAKAAGDKTVDPLIYGPILRESLEDHIRGFEEQGIDIRPALAAVFLVNILTEDNLPYYTEKNLAIASSSEPLTTWVKEWVAEEDAHGTLMRDYALLTGLFTSEDNGLIKHADYHRGRVQQLRTGTEIDPGNHAEAFHYLTPQELLTVRAHHMLSWMFDRLGIKVIKPMVGDEQNHHEFYLKGSAATLDNEEFLDESLVAMSKVYGNFVMPGKKGIPNFDILSHRIGVSGVFDLQTIAEAKRTISDKLGIESRVPKTDAGKTAQQEIIDQVSDETIQGQRDFMEMLRDQDMEKSKDKALAPFIIGRTVDFEYSSGTPARRTKLVVVGS